MNEVATKNGNYSVAFIADGAIPQLEAFTKKLNQKPTHVEVTQGAEGVPITTIETELDEDYMGLWQTENFRFQAIANEIVGSIDLLVFHPIAKIWIRRTGSAAVLIRQKKDADLTDIGAKIKNGLMMDFPKLESMCIKSAAKRLGAKYGRNLNRKFEDTYEPIYTDEIVANQTLEEIQDRMSKCKTSKELGDIFNEFPDLHNNAAFKKAFTSYKNQLNLRK